MAAGLVSAKNDAPSTWLNLVHMSFAFCYGKREETRVLMGTKLMSERILKTAKNGNISSVIQNLSMLRKDRNGAISSIAFTLVYQG